MGSKIGYKSKNNYRQFDWNNCDNDAPKSIFLQKSPQIPNVVNFLVLTEKRKLYLCKLMINSTINKNVIAENVDEALFVGSNIFIRNKKSISIRKLNNPLEEHLLYEFDKNIVKMTVTGGMGLAIFTGFGTCNFNIESMRTPMPGGYAKVVNFTKVTQEVVKEPKIIVKTFEDMKQESDDEKETVGDFKISGQSLYNTNFIRNKIYKRTISFADKSVIYDHSTTIINFDIRTQGDSFEIITIECKNEFPSYYSPYSFDLKIGSLFKDNFFFDYVLLKRQRNDFFIDYFDELLKEQFPIQAEYILNNDFFSEVNEVIKDFPVDVVIKILSLIIRRQKHALYTHNIRSSKRVEILNQYFCDYLRPPVVPLLQSIWEYAVTLRNQVSNENKFVYYKKVIKMINYININTTDMIIPSFISNKIYRMSYKLTDIVIDTLGNPKFLFRNDNFKSLEYLWKIYQWVNVNNNNAIECQTCRRKINKITKLYIALNERGVNDFAIDYFNNYVLDDIKNKILEIQFMSPDTFVSEIAKVINERMPFELSEKSKYNIKKAVLDLNIEKNKLINNQAKVSLLECSYFKSDFALNLRKISTID